MNISARNLTFYVSIVLLYTVLVNLNIKCLRNGYTTFMSVMVLYTDDEDFYERPNTREWTQRCYGPSKDAKLLVLAIS